VGIFIGILFSFWFILIEKMKEIMTIDPWHIHLKFLPYFFITFCFLTKFNIGGVNKFNTPKLKIYFMYLSVTVMPLKFDWMKRLE
jgi:hypothetical protein